MAIDALPAPEQTHPSAPLVPFSVRVLQALMLFVGVVGTFGVIYFTMLEPEPGMDALDGLVATLLLIASLGYIAAGRKLSIPDRDIWFSAAGFAAMRVALSVVKVFAYGEGEATLFLVLDVVILALVATHLSSTARRIDEPGGAGEAVSRSWPAGQK
jgi:hypothetical protein